MSASWLPFVYTSLPGVGLDVHSASKDLSRVELEELARWAAYTRPQDLPREPTPEQLALFPVAHGYFRLPSSGRCVIFKSQYIGLDYSGRPGNYLAQAFVLDSGFLPACPALFLNSPSFTPLPFFLKQLTAGGTAAWPLSARNVPFADFRPRPPLSAEEFADIIDTDRHLARSGLACLRTGKSLLVECASTDDWLTVFECWQRSFGPQLGHLVTGNSYSSTPAEFSQYMVQGLAEPLSDYKRREVASRSVFHVLKQEQDAGTGDRYARFVHDCSSISWDNSKEFFAFLQMFRYDTINEELADAVLLWQLLQTPDTPCTVEEFSAALQFGLRYGNPEFFKKSISVLFSGNRLDLLCSPLEIARALSLAAFLASENACTADPDQRTGKVFFWKVLGALLQSGDPGPAVRTAQAMLMANSRLAPALLADLASFESADSLLRSLEKPASWPAVLTVLGEAFRRAGREFHRLPVAQRLIQSFAAVAHSGMAPFPADMDDAHFVFGAFAMSIAGDRSRAFESIEHAIGSALETRDSSARTRILHLVEDAGLERASFNLHLRLYADGSPDQLAAVFTKLFKMRQFTAAEKKEILNSQIQSLDGNLPGLALLVERTGATIAKLDGAGAVLDVAATRLTPPWSPADQKAIGTLKKFASTHGIATPLLNFAALLADPKVFPPPLHSRPDLSGALAFMETLPPDQYLPYAKFWLASLWSKVTKPIELEVLQANAHARRCNECARAFADLLDEGLLNGLQRKEEIVWWVASFGQYTFPPKKRKENEPLEADSPWHVLIPAYTRAFTALGKARFRTSMDLLMKKNYHRSWPWNLIMEHAESALKGQRPKGVLGSLLNKFKI